MTVLAQVVDPNGRRVELTVERWDHVVNEHDGHPELDAHIADVMLAVSEPHEQRPGRREHGHLRRVDRARHPHEAVIPAVCGREGDGIVRDVRPKRFKVRGRVHVGADEHKPPGGEFRGELVEDRDGFIRDRAILAHEDQDKPSGLRIEGRSPEVEDVQLAPPGRIAGRPLVGGRGLPCAGGRQDPEERRGSGSKRPRDHKGKGNDKPGRPGQSGQAGQAGRNDKKTGGRPGKPSFGGANKSNKNKSGRSGKGKGGKRR